MDVSLIEALIAKNKPFKSETAAGRSLKRLIGILSAFPQGKLH
jgi:hypothetical protein